MKNKREKILNLILPLISVLAIFFLWAIASLSIGNEYVLPSIYQTFKALIEIMGGKEFYLSLIFTLLRSVISFFVSFIIAFIFAFLTYKSDKPKRILSPLISIIRALPTVAIVLLLLFWTNSFIAPIIVTMIVVLPTVYTNILSAFYKVDTGVLEMCKHFEVPKREVMKKVVVPRVKPDILRTIGSNLSLNVKLMVAAEVLSQTARSMGNLLNSAKIYLEIANMIALVVIVVIIGLIIESVFNILSEKAGKHL